MAFFKKKTADADPLTNPKFREPGIVEKFIGALINANRPLANIQIEITSHCAGKCVYCPHTTMKANWHSRHMSAEVMASLWPLLRNAEHAHLQGWGEPLLHPRFFDFIKFAARAGCQTSTTSCGANLGDEIIDKLVENGPDTIAFSLTGTDEKTNSARQGVNFTEVCENIKKLNHKIKAAGHGPEIHIAYLLLANQLDAVKNIPDLLDKLDIPCAVISTLDYLAEPEQCKLAFGIGEYDKIERAKATLEETAQKARTLGRQIVFALPDAAVACETGCRENIANSLYVDADGQISPCVYLNVPARGTDRGSVVFGNSLEDNVWEIWKKPEYRDFRQSLISGDTPAQCQNCPKRKELVYVGE